MSIADQISSTEQLQRDPNLKYLVHAPPGYGKTYLIRTMPGNVICGSAESGLQSIADTDIDYVELTSITQLRELYKYLASGDHDYDSLALDSITEIGEICLSEMKEEHKDGRQAYGEMQEAIIKLLRAFRSLNMTVYFSAKQQREKTDRGLLQVPNMPGSTLTTKRPIGHDFDFVFPIVVSEDSEGNLNRQFLTEADGQHQAKARDPNHVLDKYEPCDISHVQSKIMNSYTEEDTNE
jgi:phage nucleotide-binding protein